ncbi:MAG: hypothetical protein ACRC6K_04345 [Fusobacteriaceae bacterium]
MFTNQGVIEIDAALGYSQYLVTMAHNNQLPQFLGIISGSTSYYGVHMTTIFSSNSSIVITQGTGGVPLKIAKTSIGPLMVSITPLGGPSTTEVFMKLV